jgi:hypothetical protein
MITDYKITILSNPEQVLTVKATGVKVEAVETIPEPPPVEPPPMVAADIIISPSNGPCGTIIQIKGLAFGGTPGTKINITAGWGESKVIETFYYGNFDTTLTVPANAVINSYVIEAQTLDEAYYSKEVFTVTTSPVPPTPPEPPVTEATLYLIPDSGPPECYYTIKGVKFGGGAMVVVDTPWGGLQFIAEPDGSFSLNTAIPWEAEAGKDYTITATAPGKKAVKVFKVI